MNQMSEKKDNNLEMKKINTGFEIARRLIILSFASAVMALNIKSFVHTAGLYPGGATGLTLLIQRYVEMVFHFTLSYTVINVLMNLFPIYIGYHFIGKKFTLYSCYTIMLTNILTDLIPGYVITEDILLISVFGGIINGCVISLCLRAGATTGGTDFVAIYLSSRKGMDSFPVVLGINAVIIGLAGVLFGWDKALYSIIYQYVSTQVLHLLYKQYQQDTLLIVTNNAKDVFEAISDLTNHGATILEGTGSFKQEKRDVVYSVVSSAQTKQVVSRIKEKDPQAFVNVIRTEQISGRFYLRKYD